MGCLGFWLTHNGAKIINRKIEAITSIKPRNSEKEVKMFMGVINYYRNMWPRRSHTLAPLTKLTSIKRNFKYTQAEQDDFEKITRIVARDTLSTYPDFNEHLKFIPMLARSY